MGTLNVAFLPHKLFKEYPNRNDLEDFHNLGLKYSLVNMDVQVMN